jgi:hypothetical protein
MTIHGKLDKLNAPDIANSQLETTLVVYQRLVSILEEQYPFVLETLRQKLKEEEGAAK